MSSESGSPDLETVSGWAGLAVVDRKGEDLGSVLRVFQEQMGGAPSWLAVRVASGATVVVPARGAGRRGEQVTIAVTVPLAMAAPPVEAGTELSPDDESRLRAHYDLPAPPPAPATGPAGAADAAAGISDAEAAPDAPRLLRSPPPGPSGSRRRLSAALLAALATTAGVVWRRRTASPPSRVDRAGRVASSTAGRLGFGSAVLARRLGRPVERRGGVVRRLSGRRSGDVTGLARLFSGRARGNARPGAPRGTGRGAGRHSGHGRARPGGEPGAQRLRADGFHSRRGPQPGRTGRQLDGGAAPGRHRRDGEPARADCPHRLRAGR